MPFKKYVEVFTKHLYHDRTRPIIGVFKDKTTGKVVRGDDFLAKVVGKTAEDTYRTYLEWFNYTRTEHESEREFVSAKWAE